MDFWREFLDEMAGHRFNVLSLWSLHPFPSIVKVPEYPDIALDDVIGTTLKFNDTFSTMGKDMLRPAILEHLRLRRRTWMTVHNDDIYSFRWGDPEYCWPRRSTPRVSSRQVLRRPRFRQGGKHAGGGRDEHRGLREAAGGQGADE